MVLATEFKVITKLASGLLRNHLHRKIARCLASFQATSLGGISYGVFESVHALKIRNKKSWSLKYRSISL